MTMFSLARPQLLVAAMGTVVVVVMQRAIAREIAMALISNAVVVWSAWGVQVVE